MTSIANSIVSIQTSPQSVFSTPEWFGELTVMAHFLTQQEVLTALTERVRFARHRFGRYEVIDFVAVLIGYALSAERTRGAPSTYACTPLLRPSWRSLGGNACPLARRSVAFWPL
jgi:hypothetical protein